jgi:hypothetical protein
MQEVEESKENRRTKERGIWTTEHGYGHCVSVEEGHLILVMEVAKAIASKEAELTTRNSSSTQTDDVPTTVDISTQTTTSTNEMSTQTDNSPQLALQSLVMHPEPPATVMSQSTTLKNLANSLQDRRPVLSKR